MTRTGSATMVVMILSGWVLWHDVAVYRAAAQTRLAGPTYQVTSYDTEARCQVGQRTAMTKEETSRAGRTTERVSDGIKVWDPDREYYTLLRYRCARTGVATVPFE